MFRDYVDAISEHKILLNIKLHRIHPSLKHSYQENLLLRRLSHLLYVLFYELVSVVLLLFVCYILLFHLIYQCQQAQYTCIVHH